jgi:asparagine synthase (glutamine-hydrolysing)
MSWDEAVESTRDAFRQAIRLALRSDVPVGCCLSGGIDSSSIVGTVTREFGIPMHTFSACWNTAECDEQFYIDAVARHCHTIPHKVFPSEAEAIVDLDALVGCHDEPVGGGAQYAQWRVMQLARQNGVKVLLDGQGGDECLCGYNKYRYFYLRWLLARRRGLTATAHVIDSLRWGDQGLLRLAQGQRYLPRLLRRCYPQVAALLRPAWRKLQRNTWAQRMRGVTDIHEHQLADLQHWSLPLLLRAEDRNSMAHSVESRVPMVDDHRFVEHCLTLPEETFFRCGKTKRLLTEGMGKALPEEVHQRRTKMGYNTPQARWMKGRLGHVLEQRVRQSSRLAELIDTQAAAGTFVAYRNGARSVGEAALYRIADLAMWLERFGVDFAMDSPAAVSGPLRRAA